MKNYDCIIIYESIYKGNTKKIAEAMAHTIGCKIATAKEALNIDLSQYKTIGLGSGVYFGSHHPAIFAIVERMENSQQDTFIFSTRGNPMHGKYHKPIKEALLNKSKRIIGEFTVKGYDGTGPFLIFGGGNCGRPNEKDIEKAVKFIRTTLPEYCVTDYYKLIKNHLPVKDGTVNTYRYNHNNNSIIIKGDIVSINQNICIGCGKCITVCPMDVIEIQSDKAMALRELDCTLCSLCAINCKERAIYIHYSWKDAINVAKRHSGRNSL